MFLSEGYSFAYNTFSSVTKIINKMKTNIPPAVKSFVTVNKRTQFSTFLCFYVDLPLFLKQKTFLIGI